MQNMVITHQDITNLTLVHSISFKTLQIFSNFEN